MSGFGVGSEYWSTVNIRVKTLDGTNSRQIFLSNVT